MRITISHMYFRWKHTKTGKAIQLVSSHRDRENRPRQTVLLSLGNAFLPESQWGMLAEEIHNRLHGILSLFAAPEDIAIWADRIVHMLQQKGIGTASDFKTEAGKALAIFPDAIIHEQTTELGPLLVVKEAWDSLELPSLLRQLSFSEIQIHTAAASIFNRLIDPSSEHAIPAWLRTTSFGDLFQAYRLYNKDRYYRIADLLFGYKDAIETYLAKKEQTIFSLDRSIYLYDLTNTYFEGKCLRIPKANRGNSKEKRSDAPLLGVGLVLDREGFPLCHRIFEGNLNDHKALLPVIEDLDQKGLNQKPTIILDSGFSSEENLRMLTQRGYEYIVVGKRPGRLAYAEEFSSSFFKEVEGREGKPSVRIAYQETETEKVILCLSEGRAEKEKAILSKAEKKFLRDLEKLKARIAKGRLRDKSKAERSLGRLLERHSRVSRFYHSEISYTENEIALNFYRLDEKYMQAEQLAGGYYLRCSRKDLSDDAIWHLYMMLTRVEAGFKALKSHLGLRPLFHQREDRCESHIFITILAYHLLHWIEHKLRLAGDNRSWPTIRRLLQTHAYTTIVCPTVDRGIYRLRTAGVPDAEQRKIYQTLGVKYTGLPRRQILA